MEGSGWQERKKQQFTVSCHCSLSYKVLRSMPNINLADRRYHCGGKSLLAVLSMQGCGERGPVEEHCKSKDEPSVQVVFLCDCFSLSQLASCPRGKFIGKQGGNEDAREAGVRTDGGGARRGQGGGKRHQNECEIRGCADKLRARWTWTFTLSGAR